ncbi:MAG: hypothetical protein IPN20_04925 [Haliscomenobacter sp.]|nr:hypothetical protein [Haliscomenobacter sp.]
MFLPRGIAEKLATANPGRNSVATKIFRPLGRRPPLAPWKGSYADLAKGYRTDDKDPIHPMDEYRIEGMGPAGAIASAPRRNWLRRSEPWTYGGKSQAGEFFYSVAPGPSVF